MNKLQKEQLISEVRKDLQGKSLIVVCSQSGVSVAESTVLRREIRNIEARFRVVKNTLLNLAIKDTEFDGLRKYLSGPTAIAYSEDPVGIAKVVSNFADDHSEKFQIVAGWLDGRILSKELIGALAKLPSLDELRAKMLGIFAAPSTKIVRTINESVVRVARVISAKK